MEEKGMVMNRAHDHKKSKQGAKHVITNCLNISHVKDPETCQGKNVKETDIRLGEDTQHTQKARRKADQRPISVCPKRIRMNNQKKRNHPPEMRHGSIPGESERQIKRNRCQGRDDDVDPKRDLGLKGYKCSDNDQ